MIALVFAVAWGVPSVLMLLDGRRRGVARGAVAGLAGLTVCLGALAWQVAAGGPLELVAGGWPAGVGIRLRADMLGVAFALVTSVVTLAAVAQQTALGIESRSFPALAAFLQLGLTGVFLTADAFNFYVFFEVSMTAAFALAAYGGGPRQYRAAYTFAIVNLLGSVIFLISVAGLYHVTGTLDMGLIRDRIAAAAPAATLIVGATLFVAFGLKLGLFPFHFWLPPVYRDTRPAVAAMLSGALANVGTYGLVRFGGGIMPPVLDEASWVLLGLGGVSVMYGAVLALSRTVYTEVLAYSSISQAGYIMLAVGLGGPAGFSAAVAYGMVNSLNKALLFLTGEVRAPLLAHCAAVGALSVAGVPPSSGFFAKAAAFRAGAAQDEALVLAVMAAGSVLSIVYMFRAHVRRFWRTAGPAEPDSPRAVSAVVIALALLLLTAGAWPEPLVWMADRAAASLE